MLINPVALKNPFDSAVPIIGDESCDSGVTGLFPSEHPINMQSEMQNRMCRYMFRYIVFLQGRIVEIIKNAQTSALNCLINKMDRGFP